MEQVAGRALSSLRPELREAELEGADLEWGAPGEADLDDANLVRASLSVTELSSCLPPWANLSGVHSLGARLHGANLHFTDFSGANLRGAELTYASLISATLLDADVSGANLYLADLRYANLTGTILNAALLLEANLTSGQISAGQSSVELEYREWRSATSI